MGRVTRDVPCYWTKQPRSVRPTVTRGPQCPVTPLSVPPSRPTRSDREDPLIPGTVSPEVRSGSSIVYRPRSRFRTQTRSLLSPPRGTLAVSPRGPRLRYHPTLQTSPHTPHTPR